MVLEFKNSVHKLKKGTVTNAEPNSHLEDQLKDTSFNREQKYKDTEIIRGKTLGKQIQEICHENNRGSEG